jgi:hypothetical protein
MRIFIASTFALLSLTSVAFCQDGNDNANTIAAKQDAAAERAAVERQKQKELDAQYKSALGGVKTPTAPSDPWGNVRSVKAPATNR